MKTIGRKDENFVLSFRRIGQLELEKLVVLGRLVYGGLRDLGFGK